MNPECDLFITNINTYNFIDYQHLLYFLTFLMGFDYSIKYGRQAINMIDHYFSKKKNSDTKEPTV